MLGFLRVSNITFRLLLMALYPFSSATSFLLCLPTLGVTTPVLFYFGEGEKYVRISLINL